MMSLTTLSDARIDSRVAGFLLVAVFSFALGILISLTFVDHAIPMAQQPCTSSCPRLMLMSHGSSVEGDDTGSCEAASPSAYEMRRDDMLL